MKFFQVLLYSRIAYPRTVRCLNLNLYKSRSKPGHALTGMVLAEKWPLAGILTGIRSGVQGAIAPW